MNPDFRWFRNVIIALVLILGATISLSILLKPLAMDKSAKIGAVQLLRHIYAEWNQAGRSENFDVSKLYVSKSLQIIRDTNIFEVNGQKVKSAFVLKDQRFTEPVELILSDAGDIYQRHQIKGIALFETPKK